MVSPFGVQFFPHDSPQQPLLLLVLSFRAAELIVVHSFLRNFAFDEQRVRTGNKRVLSEYMVIA